MYQLTSWHYSFYVVLILHFQSMLVINHHLHHHLHLMPVQVVDWMILIDVWRLLIRVILPRVILDWYHRLYWRLDGPWMIDVGVLMDQDVVEEDW